MKESKAGLKRNIFLIGYMGSGKSTAGKILAKKLNMDFIDLDGLIEESEKTKIENIFDEKGEEKFRELEHNYLKKIVGQQNTVIALGGGTPCYHDNMQLIKENGVSVYLKMNAAALVNRLAKAKTKRPLIKNKTQEELLKYIEESLADRERFYEQADFIVDGINLNIEELVMMHRHSRVGWDPL